MGELQRPLEVRLLNDFELVVSGLKLMMEPYQSRVRVTELDVGKRADRRADITLFDTFGNTGLDRSDLEETVRDRLAGKVVIFSWNLEPKLVQTSLKLGCKGYLSKFLPAERLVELLERVAAGEVISPADYEGEHRELEPSQGQWPGRHAGLTLREAEVVSLITEGLTNPEIAAHCFITHNSLKTYIRTAYRKIGVERRAQAVRWGIENGMLRPKS